MALVEPPSYSHHDTIRSSQPSTWLPSFNLEADTVSRTSRPVNLSTAQVDGSAARLDSIFVSSLDPAAPHNRLSLGDQAGDQFATRGWYGSTSNLPRVSFDASSSPKKPFHKWMRSLHRRASHRPPLLDSHLHHPLDHLSNPDATLLDESYRNLPPISSPGSSLRFVSAVRSASVSLASVSAATRSRRRNKTRSRCLSRTDRSSKVSLVGPRVSEDSTTAEQSLILDLATTERALQRRRILEELISTEEGYIGDIRFLLNVYITILASLPAFSASLRSSINRNLTEIVELHETILGELHRVVPHSEYTQFEDHHDAKVALRAITDHTHGTFHAHRRWKSMDAAAGDHTGCFPPGLHEFPGLTSDPQVAAEVSKIFGKRMNRFFIYKEYGAKYELMMKDVASANRTMPEWESYQRGLETLASTLGSVKGNGGAAKKSLTISDLLVKPVQRVCKYPLLFAELLKFTPICDCPNSHMEIDSTLTRLREATGEINKATNDAHVKATLEKTWLLQDRLMFPHREFDAATRSHIRSFGRIQLCGALHVCWQTKDSVDGHYMICLLYQDILCLAFAGKIDPIYTIMASIHLGGAKVEDVDNGRGLQCHTAPFSWKLVFECDYQLYEIIMTACSPKEEMEWRSRLDRAGNTVEDVRDMSVFGSLELEMKSLGSVFGKPGTSARRLSIQRATTVASKAPLYQVVLKNTSFVRDGAATSTSGLAINRSQSLLTTNTRLPVLTPSRGDRARLEALLSDVWSREVLPFPGMAGRSRSEHLVRASSVMRKLSVASLTGSFSKRSGSGFQASKPGEQSDLEDCATIQEFDGDANSLRRLKRPRMQRTCETNLSNEMSRIGISGGQGTMEKAGGFGTAETMPRVSGDSKTHGLPDLLRASSTTNLYMPQSQSGKSERSDTTSLLSTAKENAYGEAPVDRTRSTSRWAKVGINRNDSRGHSFRSLFR